jgi:hypothetical protein
VGHIAAKIPTQRVVSKAAQLPRRANGEIPISKLLIVKLPEMKSIVGKIVFE